MLVISVLQLLRTFLDWFQFFTIMDLKITITYIYYYKFQKVSHNTHNIFKRREKNSVVSVQIFSRDTV